MFEGYVIYIDLNDNDERNYSEKHNGIIDIFLTDEQLELTNKINNAFPAGANYNTDDEKENNDDIDMVDCKYYIIDSSN